MLLVSIILSLLSYSNGYSQDSSSTGGIDSISISVDDVRKLNEKLIDYEYLKQEIKIYKDITYSQENQISILKEYNNDLTNKYNKEHKKANIFKEVSCGLGFLVIFLIIA